MSVTLIPFVNIEIQEFIVTESGTILVIGFILRAILLFLSNHSSQIKPYTMFTILPNYLVGTPLLVFFEPYNVKLRNLFIGSTSISKLS